ncbi:heterokaryon incompatibility protein-domain-containing protein [Nemania sp. FL0031]|nr:heterokaryon incompatibility protein-domain-containing protein [Nemania sp. FL0031]
MSPPASKSLLPSESREAITSELTKAVDAYILSDRQIVCTDNVTAREHGATYRAERRESYPFMELGFARSDAKLEYSTINDDLLTTIHSGIELPCLDAEGYIVPDSQQEPTELAAPNTISLAVNDLNSPRCKVPLHSAHGEAEDLVQVDRTRQQPFFLDTPFSRVSVNVDFLPIELNTLFGESSFQLSNGESKDFASGSHRNDSDSQERSPSGSQSSSDSRIHIETESSGLRPEGTSFFELDTKTSRSFRRSRSRSRSYSPDGAIRQRRMSRLATCQRDVPKQSRYTDTPFPSYAIANGSRLDFSPDSSQRRRRHRRRSRSRSQSRRKAENRRSVCIGKSQSSTLTPTCERLENETVGKGQIVSEAGVAPLRHIKLIKLLTLEYSDQQSSDGQRTPENKENQTPISACLDEFVVGSTPRFVALSYVWGNDIPSTSIDVNGEPFAIRDNLTLALRQLQTLCPDTYIWTDAICINQSNEEEKSHIVQHMGQIFHAAEKVYAWLGLADPGVDGPGDSSDALWDHLEQLGNLFWDETGRDNHLDQMPLNLNPMLDKLLPELNTRLGMPSQQGGFPTLAYSRFSNRVYWQRVWVLQEVHLARELVFCCGSKTMISKTLAGALILLESYQKYIASRGLEAGNPKLQEFAFTAPCYPEMHRMLIYTSIYPAEVHSLRIAMTNFCVKELPRGARSTDPRDMVFGLLGFANAAERGYIKADYKKTVQEVYRDTARALMQRGWTDILAWSQPSEKIITGLPSWVPDFSSTIFETMCSQGQAKPWLPRFSAAANLKPTFYAGDVKGEWNLRWPGVVIDKVEEVGSLWHPRAGSGEVGNVQSSGEMQSRSASYEAILTFLSETKRFAEESIRSHPVPPRGIHNDNAKRLEATWRIPCADQLLVDSKFIRDDASMQETYEAALEDARKYVSAVGEGVGKVSGESRRYIETILRWVKKRPLLGAQGYVGLAPGDVQKGDLLVLLQSCNAPYILRKRPLDRESESYALIGEAFIWGIMDGEYRPRDSEEFIFDIC